MVFFALTVFSFLLLTPLSISHEDDQVMTLVANVNHLITQFQEDHDNHQKDLSNLLDQKTVEWKDLLDQQEQFLTVFASSIASGLKEELSKVHVQDGITSARLCTMQKALVGLLEENPSNSTRELISLLRSSEECPDLTRKTSEDCLPQPMKPEETLEMFQLHAESVGTCSNQEPVLGFNKCHGHCESTTDYNRDGDRQGSFVSRCTCCKPARFEKITVSMSCENGVTFTRNYDNIVACQCLNCEDISE